MLVELSVRELCDSKLYGLLTFDNMVILLIYKRSQNQEGRLCVYETPMFEAIFVTSLRTYLTYKWHTDFGNIHTTRNSCRGTLSTSLIPNSVSLLSGDTMQLENTNSCIFKVTAQVWEKEKDQH